MARGATFADLDQDGDLDLYIANVGKANEFLINDGSCHFTEGAKVRRHAHQPRLAMIHTLQAAGIDDSGVAQGMKVAELNGDGMLDIVVSNIGPLEGSLLFLNQGHGKFKEVSSEAGISHRIFGQGIAMADVDNDGDMDMYACTYGTPPLSWPSQDNRLYMNGASGLSWLKVRPLDAVHGKPTLLQSQVRVFEAGTATMLGTDVVDGGSGFCSQNEYGAYFGLDASVHKGVAAFDVEMRKPGQKEWTTKKHDPALGGVKPNSVLRPKCCA